MHPKNYENNNIFCQHRFLRKWNENENYLTKCVCFRCGCKSALLIRSSQVIYDKYVWRLMHGFHSLPQSLLVITLSSDSESEEYK